jgi:hypothetical protein
MTIGLLLGAGLFLACAVLGEKHALYIPAVVLLTAAAANVIGGVTT